MSAPTVISADSHVQEPPELYAERLPARFRHRAPRIVERDGARYSVIDGKRPAQHGCRRRAHAARPSDDPARINVAAPDDQNREFRDDPSGGRDLDRRLADLASATASAPRSSSAQPGRAEPLRSTTQIGRDRAHRRCIAERLRAIGEPPGEQSSMAWRRSVFPSPSPRRTTTGRRSAVRAAAPTASRRLRRSCRSPTSMARSPSIGRDPCRRRQARLCIGGREVIRSHDGVPSATTTARAIR